MLQCHIGIPTFSTWYMGGGRTKYIYIQTNENEYLLGPKQKRALSLKRKERGKEKRKKKSIYKQMKMNIC